MDFPQGQRKMSIKRGSAEALHRRAPNDLLATNKFLQKQNTYISGRYQLKYRETIHAFCC